MRRAKSRHANGVARHHARRCSIGSGSRTSARRRRRCGTRRSRRTGSTRAGRSASSDASNSRPANAPSRTARVHARERARRPPAIISRGQRARRELPQRERAASGRCRRAALRDSARTSSRNRSPNATCVKPSATACGDRGAHALLVHLVRARVRNAARCEAAGRGARLRLEHLAPHGVHRHAVDRLVDRRQQGRDGAGCCWFSTCSAQALSLPELHDSRIFI